MKAVNNESVSTRLYSYTKVFGEPPKEFPESSGIPKLTVYDQKKTLMCVGYGLATALEILFGKQFSAAWGYGMYRDESHKGQGLYFIKAIDYLCKLGAVPLADFGAVEDVPKILELVKNHPELLEIASKHKPSGYCNLNYADKDLKDRCIKDALCRWKEGVAVVATSSKHFGYNHCIAIVDWNDKTNSYVFQNSEGRDYGNDGRSEIPKDRIGEICAIFTKPYVLPFKDVPEDDYGYKSIKNLFLAEIIKGITDTEFNPDGYVTRRDIAIMIDRALSKVDKQAARNILLQYESE
jgi:hypothetical protein